MPNSECLRHKRVRKVVQTVQQINSKANDYVNFMHKVRKFMYILPTSKNGQSIHISLLSRGSICFLISRPYPNHARIRT